MATKSVFELINVTFAYSARAQPILKNVSFRIGRGEFVGIAAPTGAGKSTLLYMLTGAIPHYYGGEISGQVLIQGREAASMKMGEITSQVGLVMQDPESQLFNLYVTDEMAWGLECRGHPRQEMSRRVEESLRRFDISHLRERVTYDLSGGEKQKVTIASIDAIRPHAIVFDNPTSQLDPLGSRMVFDAVSQLAEKGHTIVMVDDKLDKLVAYAERIILIHEGQVKLDSETRSFCRKRDEVASYGLALPQVAELAYQLREEGIELDSIPTTADEGFHVFTRLLDG